MSFLRNRLVLGAIAMLLLTIGGKLIWNRYGALVKADPRYRLTSSAIQVNESPEWIQSDVRAEAIRLGGLDELSLLDRDVVRKVQEAFQLQTWVAGVNSIRKTPSGVEVDLTYRKPVAMVEFRYDGRDKLQPVDRDGVLLPGIEFSQVQATQYLRIRVPNPRLNGLIDGTAWPDERIQEAAAVAAAVSPQQIQLGLFRIILVEDLPGGETLGKRVFGLQTEREDVVIWGSPPGQEVAGEAASDLRLETLVGLKHALTNVDEREPISRYDIRSGAVIRLPFESEIARQSTRLPPEQPSQEWVDNPWGQSDYQPVEER